MVVIAIQRDSTGNPIGFIATGHAGFKKKGSDIVCAGISSLTLTAALALEQLTKLQLQMHEDIQKGILECSWVMEPSELERTNIIIQIMLIGLQEIQRQYPGYLKVCEVEV